MMARARIPTSRRAPTQSGGNPAIGNETAGTGAADADQHKFDHAAQVPDVRGDLGRTPKDCNKRARGATFSP